MPLLEYNPRIVGAKVTLGTIEKRLAQNETCSEHLFLHFNLLNSIFVQLKLVQSILENLPISIRFLFSFIFVIFAILSEVKVGRVRDNDNRSFL